MKIFAWFANDNRLIIGLVREIIDYTDCSFIDGLTMTINVPSKQLISVDCTDSIQIRPERNIQFFEIEEPSKEEEQICQP